MGYGMIILEKKETIGILTLNRPEKSNTLSSAFLNEIIQGLREIDDDEDVRVIVIQSQGKHFCAGADISESRPTTVSRQRDKRFAKLAAAVHSLKKPVIAAVHGAATAGGCGLALACDLVIASEDARFGLTGINVGLFCFGPAVPLSRTLGWKKALELLLTGDIIPAGQALGLGMINRVVPRESLEKEVMELAGKLARKSPLALQMGKEGFYALAEMPYRQALDCSESLIAILSSTEDAEEGIRAFLEKREARWKKC